MSSDNRRMRTAPLHLSQILAGVSRSFGLSIRLLPAGLRDSVSQAYLLARLTDTVADTTTVAPAQRLALLDSLRHAFNTPTDHPQLALALRDFARQVSDPHERALLTQGQGCLDALQQQPAAVQTVIREVLEAITQGQRWDLQTLDGPQCGVQTSAELDRYTWLVAGSVGEFWTRICALHLQQWHRGDTAQLMQWGANYGKGLQRLNILRDAGHDLRAGRCYFPAQELEPLGLDNARLCTAAREGDRAVLQQLQPLLERWQTVTEEQLHEGLRYSLSLQGRRLRLASALPCLIGIRTLTLLRQSGQQALIGHVKLPRRAVQGLLLRLLLGGVSDRQLLAQWAAGKVSPA